ECTASVGGAGTGRGSSTVRARLRGRRADGDPAASPPPCRAASPDPAAGSAAGRLPPALQSTGRTRRAGAVLPALPRRGGRGGADRDGSGPCAPLPLLALPAPPR